MCALHRHRHRYVSTWYFSYQRHMSIHNVCLLIFFIRIHCNGMALYVYMWKSCLASCFVGVSHPNPIHVHFLCMISFRFVFFLSFFFFDAHTPWEAFGNHAPVLATTYWYEIQFFSSSSAFAHIGDGGTHIYSRTQLSNFEPQHDMMMEYTELASVP